MYLLPKVIKTKRTELKQTRKELSEYFGVTTQTVRSYETGNYVPNEEMYQPLADFLGVHVREVERMCDTERRIRRGFYKTIQVSTSTAEHIIKLHKAYTQTLYETNDDQTWQYNSGILYGMQLVLMQLDIPIEKMKEDIQQC